MEPTDEARWRAYQAWLRKHGDGFTEPHHDDEPSSRPRQTAAARSSRPGRRSWGVGVGLAAALALLLAAALSLAILPGGRHTVIGAAPGAPVGPPPPSGGLRVEADGAPPARVSASLTAPCFVAGRPAGDLSLSACARRNGVASGRLDVGLGPGARPGPPTAAPVAPVAAERETEPPVEPVADAGESLRTVSQFYRALADGDETGAAERLVPDRRAEGALSAAGLGRLGPEAPLHITELDPLGPSSVLVRYEIQNPNGDACDGSAHVETVVRGDETLVRSIHAIGGC